MATVATEKPMKIDTIATAFSAWTEAQTACAEAEKRLAESKRAATGTDRRCSQALEAEVAALKVKADRLLTEAMHELSKTRASSSE